MDESSEFNGNVIDAGKNSPTAVLPFLSNAFNVAVRGVAGSPVKEIFSAPAVAVPERTTASVTASSTLLQQLVVMNETGCDHADDPAGGAAVLSGANARQ